MIVCRSPHNRKIYFVLLPFPVVVCSGRVPVLVVCPDGYLSQSYTRTYIRAHIHTRTGIFR